MTRIGLTGGIASGKSFVADALAELGAVVIDADVLAREVVAPGTDGLAAVVERFGADALRPDGSLDRPKLGEVVFGDDAARADLNAIVHPRVRARAAELEAAAPSGSVVVHVIPLLVETGQADSFDGVIVVDVAEELQVERLVGRDGLTAEQAHSRLRAQASRAERLSAADWVIDNSGSREHTLRQVEAFWAGPLADLRAPVEAMERVAPSAVGIDAAGVLALVDALSVPEIELHSIMVARDGKVAVEGWAEPYAAHDIALVYSCSKSFTATAVGMLVRDRKLDVSARVLDHLPWDDLATRREEVDPRWEAVLLEHCLSMTLGHLEDAWGPIGRTFGSDADLLDVILTNPPEQEPGTFFCYNQVATYLAARVVEDVAGEPLVDFLERRLFQPLGVRPVATHRDLRGRALGFSGLHVRTEALLALAQLYLDGGRWAGEQLLDPEWVERASTPYGPTPGDAGDWSLGYGFSFWKCREGYRGDGAYGQFMVVLPERRLAVAITSETTDMQAVLDAMFEHLVPALDREGSPHVDDALAQRLAELQVLPPREYSAVALRDPLVLRREAAPGTAQWAVPADFDELTLSDGPRGWVLRLRERGRIHETVAGSAWTRSQWRFDRTRLAIAARGGWLDDDTFEADLVAVQTPHRYVLRASRSRVTFDLVPRYVPLNGPDPAWLGLPA